MSYMSTFASYNIYILLYIRLESIVYITIPHPSTLYSLRYYMLYIFYKNTNTVRVGMAAYVPAKLSLDPVEAAKIHAEALSRALAAKSARRTAQEKEEEEDASDKLRRALGSCANREQLFSTPDYCIDKAFSPEAFPDDAEWVASGGLGPHDKILDIGCGDGRAIIKAAKRGARAVGYEINDQRAEEALANVAAESDPNVRSRIEVHALNCVEVIDTALADGVTFVFMYLTPRGIRKLLKYFRANPRPLRVVSYVNPIREGTQFRPGDRIPGRKLWCESNRPSERELGVKFPIYCYRFGFAENSLDATGSNTEK